VLKQLIITTMTDYPFATWNDFCNAIKDEFHAEDSSCDLTNYYNFLKDENGDIYFNNNEYFTIFNEMLEKGLDPKEGINKLIETICYHSRIYEMARFLPKIVKLFVKHGVTIDDIDTSPIFTQQYEFEDDMSTDHVKGLMIYILQKEKLLDMSIFENVESIYWEDLPYEEINKWQKEGINKDQVDKAYLSALKNRYEEWERKKDDYNKWYPECDF
jgi:hypothetical protein